MLSARNGDVVGWDGADTARTLLELSGDTSSVIGLAFVGIWGEGKRVVLLDVEFWKSSTIASSTFSLLRGLAVSHDFGAYSKDQQPRWTRIQYPCRDSATHPTSREARETMSSEA
jgi:hypothetical protein